MPENATGRKITRTRQPLPDVGGPGARVVFVGINPSVRSAELGHHYAGRGNRFWRLLHASGLLPEPFTFADDVRCAALGFGLTNLVDRATPSSTDLGPDDLAAGAVRLRRKLARWRPELVACVGVLVYRALFGVRGEVVCGLAEERLGDARVWVLPNPSGRNAHYPWPRMIEAYRDLAAWNARR